MRAGRPCPYGRKKQASLLPLREEKVSRRRRPNLEQGGEGSIIAIFNKAKESLGLDIGSSSIKVVELRKGKKGIELIQAHLVEIVPAGNDKKAKGKKGVGEALEKVLGERRAIKGKSISLAVPGPSVYIRYVKLPPADSARIAQIVNYEAQQQIPLPLEEVIWDYQILKKKAMDIDVVLVATKLELINSLLEEAAVFQIEPEVIDYSPLASYNCLKFSQELSGEETFVFLNMGARSTEISIEREGSLCWTRSIPLGGRDLTRAIQQSFGLSFAEAEKLKREEIIDLGNEEKKISQVVTPLLSRLVNDIERSLTFFQVESKGGIAINRILLSGGGAELANLDKFLERELKVEVRKVSPLGNIHLSHGFPFPGQEASFAVAIGLALRPLVKCPSEINLLPLDLIRKKEFQKKKGDFAFSFILALLIAGTVYGFTFQDYFLKRHRLEALEKELGEFQKYEQPVKAIRGEVGDSVGRLKALRDLASGKDFWLEVLLELSRLLPDEIKLSSFSQEQGVLILRGEAPTIPIIRDLVFQLESSPLFGEVEVGTPVRVRGEEEFFQFNLRVPLKLFPFPREEVVPPVRER